MKCIRQAPTAPSWRHDVFSAQPYEIESILFAADWGGIHMQLAILSTDSSEVLRTEEGKKCPLVTLDVREDEEDE
ncbi:hypothetical protein CERZMDRAFT_91445 [Cercospora zeae-maydis SCOH1-5]|uniref:Uncharacterized protein n=1 Tax=Cercospora zeae-maydis SCOH1-5 TaxID=717836 RepID=A0A6A6F6U6_9PEZI|nr:hypothetical protein CERZMDRAFT_91445 [Cercospora zeae-maydis SCOH1-5]